MSKLSRSRQRRVLDVPPKIRTARPPSLSGHPSIDEKVLPKEVSSPVVQMNALMELYGCKQERGETVRMFAARVNQIAASFPLAKLCHCGCNQLVSYASETVLHLLICGLREKALQSMCLLEAQNGRASSESALIEFCDALDRDKQSDNEGNMEKILSQDGREENMEIDMNILSLEENLPEEEKVDSMEGAQYEAQYVGKETYSASWGIAGLFLEVARDISTVFREVIQEVDFEDDSGIKDTFSRRPTSPDMFESEEEDGNETPVDELPSAPDPGSTSLLSHMYLSLPCRFKVICAHYPGSTSPLSHLLENKSVAEANSNTSPTSGKRKKKAMKKATVEVLIDFFNY